MAKQVCSATTNDCINRDKIVAYYMIRVLGKNAHKYPLCEKHTFDIIQKYSTKKMTMGLVRKVIRIPKFTQNVIEHWLISKKGYRHQFKIRLDTI